MSLQYIIKNKLKSFDINKLAKALGYSSTQKLSERIEIVTNSDTLSLDSSHFDFHYSAPEFIRKLCEALTIPLTLCNKIIAEIEAKLQIKKFRFKSRLFVETNFKRKSEPIFALAALNGRRYLPVEGFQGIDLNDQLKYIRRLIQSHYADQTVLEMWGNISQYVYFYDEKTIIIFSTSGEVIDSVEEYFTPQATMSLRKSY
jgi:hypothetical protein